MVHLAALLSLGATPLPASPWAVAGDGATCAPVGAEILAELQTWNEDADNTVPAEGIFGRVHPARPNSLVLLFANRQACERILWAMQQERQSKHPPSMMTPEEVTAWLERRLRDEKSLAARWQRLTVEEQKLVRSETAALFAGPANRLEAHRALTAALETLDRQPRRATGAGEAAPAGHEGRRAELSVALWRALFAEVFGEPYVPAPRPPATRD